MQRSELQAKSATVADLSVRDALRLITPPRGTTGTGDNEWYTPVRFIEAARAALGEIDLDPATCEFAQSRVRAERFFTVEDESLERPWHGRVFLNPPYAQPLIGQFVHKLVEEYKTERVTAAVMLTHNYTDAAWFHESHAQRYVSLADASPSRKPKALAPRQRRGKHSAISAPTLRLSVVFGEFGFIR